MENLLEMNIYLVAFFSGLIMVSLYAIINLGIIALRIKITQKFIKYIYAFSSGVLIIAALLGLLMEGKEDLQESLHHLVEDNKLPLFNEWLMPIILIIVGSIIGIGISLTVKHFLHKSHKDSNGHSHTHFIENHYEHEQKHSSNQILSVIMILSHGIPEGLSMGMIIASGHSEQDLSAVSWPALIAFTLHNTLDSLLLYFTLRHSGRSRKRSFLWAISSVLIFIPLMLIGASLQNVMYGADGVASLGTFWIMPLIFFIVSTILIWELFSELLPEFIHVRSDSKQVRNLLLTFMLGLIITVIIFAAFGHQH